MGAHASRFGSAGTSGIFRPRRWDGNRPRPMLQDLPELVNDLETLIEVTPVEMTRGWEWQVIYPCRQKHMAQLPDTKHRDGHWKIGCNKIAVRLREAPDVGATFEVDIASQDFGQFSQREWRGTTGFWQLPSVRPIVGAACVRSVKKKSLRKCAGK